MQTKNRRISRTVYIWALSLWFACNAGLHLRARTYAIWRSVGVCSPHGSTSLKAVSYGWGDGGDFPFCGCNDQAFEKNLNFLDFFYIFAYNISEKRDLLGGSPG